MNAGAQAWSRARLDWKATERDPAARGVVDRLAHYPGLHALWGHRLAHALWESGYRGLARSVSYLVRMVTHVEIHPGAQIGGGLLIDHGSGVVIGETAEVGEDVTMYHGVTLGGVGGGLGRRHPKVGSRVLLGARATVLGAVDIGDDSRIGAGAVVLHDVPAGASAVGVPARVVER